MVTINNTEIKTQYRYFNDGEIIAECICYEYDTISNFDWVLISDIQVLPEYRRQGFASKLIETVEQHTPKDKGLYLLIKTDNKPAINLYKKQGFEIIVSYKIKDTPYYIMCKGDADINQLKPIALVELRKEKNGSYRLWCPCVEERQEV